MPPSDPSPARITTVNDLGQPIGAPLDFPRVALPATEVLTGRWCRLEPLGLEHAAALFEAYAAADDDGDWTYLGYGPWRSEADMVGWVETMAGHSDPQFFTIVNPATGEAEGVASYLRHDQRGGVIEVGHIHFSRRMQRTPLATEAMFLMMRHAFSTGYRRYEWKCDDLNAPSRAAAARLGFQYEGTFRQATHYKGRSRDTAWFSILDAEWPAISAEFERWLSPDNFVDGAQLSALNCRAS